MDTDQLDKPVPAGTSETEPLQDEEAPLRVDVEKNDFTPPEEETYAFEFSEGELVALGNAMAELVSGAWIFSPEDTIDDDVAASYSAMQLLKKLNEPLPPTKRLGCVAESLLPFSGGDIYIGATYRLETRGKGKVITVAQFAYNSELVKFRLFDPVRYPNARKISDCLGDAVPLDDIISLEEVNHLNKEEKESFSLAIQHAWVNYY